MQWERRLFTSNRNFSLNIMSSDQCDNRHEQPVQFSHRKPQNESNKRIVKMSPKVGTRYCVRIQALPTKHSTRNADLKVCNEPCGF
jgi:hypothetical protein